MTEPTCILEYCESPVSSLWCVKHAPPNGLNGKIRHGYRVITIPYHPLAGSNNELFHHRLVLWESLGRPKRSDCHWCGRDLDWFASEIADKVCTDHLDFDKLHNRPENLVPSCASCNASRTPDGPVPSADPAVDGAKSVHW